MTTLVSKITPEELEDYAALVEDEGRSSGSYPVHLQPNISGSLLNSVSACMQPAPDFVQELHGMRKEMREIMAAYTKEVRMMFRTIMKAHGQHTPVMGPMMSKVGSHLSNASIPEDEEVRLQEHDEEGVATPAAFRKMLSNHVPSRPSKDPVSAQESDRGASKSAHRSRDYLRALERNVQQRLIGAVQRSGRSAAAGVSADHSERAVEPALSQVRRVQVASPVVPASPPMDALLMNAVPSQLGPKPDRLAEMRAEIEMIRNGHSNKDSGERAPGEGRLFNPHGQEIQGRARSREDASSHSAELLADRRMSMPDPARPFRHNLQEVRRRVHTDLMAVGGTSVEVAAALSRTTSACEGLDEAAPTPLEKLLLKSALYAHGVGDVLLRFGGLLPWSSSFSVCSRVYQVAVLLLQCAVLVGNVVRATDWVQQSLSQGLWGAGVEVGSVSYADLAVPFGSVVALLALQPWRGNSEVMKCFESLESVSEKHNYSEAVIVKSGFDVLITGFIWLCFFVDRVVCTAVEAPDYLRADRPAQVLLFVGFLLSAGELLTLTLLVLRITRYMSGMVDGFCFRFWAEMDYRQAVKEWNVLQAHLRMACTSIEFCFFALQTTVLLAVMLFVLDIRATRDNAWIWSSIIILLGGVSQIFIRAAAVTEACIRVPAIVNSISLTSDVMDQDRMYLVDYIAHSAAGFHVFDVRLTVAMVMRSFHYTLLAVFTVATRVLGL